MREVTQAGGVTPAHLALAWWIARPTVTAPIASATSLEQLEQLVGASSLRLDPAAIEELCGLTR